MKKSILSIVLLLICVKLNAQTPAMGAIDGTFDVSDLGAANYTIPIKAPEGVGGLQPALSLTYGSHGGNGVLGMGWAVSGLSAITRVPSNIYHDKKVDGIELNSNDRFALDGSRLILVGGGSYGASGSLYRTEIESFREITANGTLGTGPQSFTVKDQNGNTYEYGVGANARATIAGKTEPYMWLLNKVTDLSGNTMTYEYVNTTGNEVLISIVKYNAHPNTGVTFKSYVSFSYENRPDPNFQALAGSKIVSSKRIDGISSVQWDGYWKYYRTYVPEYTEDFYTHLTKIKELSANELEELPATEFTFGLSGSTSQTGNTIPGNLDIGYEFISGDYNGDGKTDMIQFTKNYNSSANNWHLYLSNGTSFSLAQTGNLPPTPSDYEDNEKIVNRDYRPAFFDFNGDGKEDFVYRSTKPLPSSPAKVNLYNVLLSDGSSLSALSGTIVPSNNDDYIGAFNFLDTYPMVGDFDGDGKSEILVLKATDHYTTSYSANYLIGENYLKPFGTYLLAKQLQGMPFDATYVYASGAGASKLYVIDYNADGKSEILAIWYDQVNAVSHAQVYELNVTYDVNNKPVVGNPAFVMVNDTGYPTLWHEIFTGDFNGDGVTDLLTWSTGMGWEIGYGKGNGTMNDIINGPSSLGGRPNYGSIVRPIIIGDFNGDGKSDIFNYAPSVYSSIWGYTQPSIFYSKGNHQFVNESVSSLESMIGSSLGIYWTGDYTGDGQTDILSLPAFSGYHPLRRFSFHANENRHKVEKIKNGLGVETKVNYLSLSSTGVYETGTSTYTYPFAKKAIPFKVVSSTNNDNGINTTGNTTVYTYTGLKYNLHGKGMIGFDKTAAYDQENSLTTEKTFALNTVYAYPFLGNIERIQGSYILSRDYLAYDIHHFGDKRIFPYMTTAEKSDFVSNLFTRQEYTYSAPAGTQPHGYNLGKPNAVITRNGYTTGSAPSAPAQLDLKEEVYKYPDLPNSLPIHLRSKPYSVTTTNTRLGQPAYSRRQDFTYYAATGLVNTRVSDPSTSNVLTTTFQYNAYGNVTSESDYTPGWGVSRTQAFAYDNSNRYVTGSWNTGYANVKSTTTYDPLLGLPLTVTKPDGTVTTYTYDNFGRPKTQSDNTGLLTTFTYYDGWGLGVGYWPSNARFGIAETSNTGVFTHRFYDRLGRLVRSAKKGFTGQIILQDEEYNAKGQLYRKTKPYFQYDSQQFITNTYDVRGRLTQESRPEGNNTFSYLIVGNNYEVTATNTGSQQKKTLTDKTGKTVQVTEGGGSLSYTYHSNGSILQTDMSGSGTVALNEYDNYGNLIKTTDPNYGSYEYSYNPYGEMTGKKDPKGNDFYYSFNSGGYMIQRGGPDGIYNNYYHYGTGPNCGKLITVDRIGGGGTLTVNYDYGIGDKINYEERILGSETFKTQLTYDGYGRVASRIYPNGRTIRYAYNTNDGQVERIWAGLQSNTDLYTVTYKNAYEQPVVVIQGRPQGTVPFAAATGFGYDNHGFRVGQSGNNYSGTEEWNFSYDFQPSTGNLLSRTDNKRELHETFTFDNFNRLTQATGQHTGWPTLPVNTLLDISYGPNGNILEKSDAGLFSYDQANRVSEVALYQDVPEPTQLLSFTAFNKVETIDEDGRQAEFSYWPDQSRSSMQLMDAGGIKKTKYYTPDFEKELINMPGYTITRELCYIPGPDGNIVAIWERKNGVNKMFYTLTDYLGSITHIIDENGNVVEERSFDAWGRKRNPATWAPEPAITGSLTDAGWDRGYTAHEHLPQFGIINMNGRLYDPIVGRMFSPDPYVMGSDNIQGYNRYSYALNNPLSYNDPNGEFVNFVVGAVLGGVSGWMMGRANGAKGWEMFGYIGAGTIVGLATSGVAAGVGAALSGTSTVAAVVVSGASAGLVGGFGNSMLAGQNPLDGAWKGALTGASGAALGGYLGGGIGALASGALSSGFNATLNGGDIGEIGLATLVGAGLSYGFYHGTMALNYASSELKKAVDYGSFAKMNADAQRSPFRRKEFGGVISDRKYTSAPRKARFKDHVDFDYDNGRWAPENIDIIYHTHYSRKHHADGPSTVDLNMKHINLGKYNGFVLNTVGENLRIYGYNNMHGVRNVPGHNMLIRQPFWFLPFPHIKQQ